MPLDLPTSSPESRTSNFGASRIVGAREERPPGGGGGRWERFRVRINGGSRARAPHLLSDLLISPAAGRSPYRTHNALPPSISTCSRSARAPYPIPARAFDWFHFHEFNNDSIERAQPPIALFLRAGSADNLNRLGRP